MKKVIITGGAGFAGSNFVQYMVEKYAAYDIIAVDLLIGEGGLKNLASIEGRPNYRFIKGDISSRTFVFRLFEAERPDVVVHFAEEKRPSQYIADPEKFIKTNEFGTIALLEACKRFGITHYHQVSTSEIHTGLTEKSLLYSLNPYLVSKASADMYAQSYYQTFGVPVTISRCSKIYGPYQSKEKLIPSCVKRALADQEIFVYGTGDQVHDWVHVSDHCRAVDLIINEGRPGETYYIHGHSEQTDLMAVKILLSSLGKSDKLIRLVPERPMAASFYFFKTNILESELGWAVSYNFNTGIRQTIEWYWNHQEYWR